MPLSEIPMHLHSHLKEIAKYYDDDQINKEIENDESGNPLLIRHRTHETNARSTLMDFANDDSFPELKQAVLNLFQECEIRRKERVADILRECRNED